MKMFLLGSLGLIGVYLIGQKIVDSFYITWPLYNVVVMSESPISDRKATISDNNTHYETAEYISEYIIEYPLYTLIIKNRLHGIPNVVFTIVSKTNDEIMILNHQADSIYKCIFFGQIYNSKNEAQIVYTRCTSNQIDEMASIGSRLNISFDVVSSKGKKINTEKFNTYIEQNGYLKRMDSL